MNSVIFWFFVATAFISAVGILLSKNIFKAALMLLGCLLSVAALFVFSFAEFVAVTQILVYAGGVLVLVIFGIMLTSKLSGKPLEVKNTNIFSGIMLAALTMLVISNCLFDEKLFRPRTDIIPLASMQKIGVELMTEFSLPFEIAGLLLLMALVGAGIFTSFLKEKKW